MTRVVFITQQFDPEDANLAIVVPQVAAIARRVDEVVVISDRIVEEALPRNARSHSFHARTRIGRGLRLFNAVGVEMPRLRRGGVVVAHMVPVYAIIVAPLVRPSGVPLLMWWSHWKMDGVVRMAERVCTKVVTVAQGTFPGGSKKLVTVGQAIDVENFPERSGERTAGPLRVIVIGRYSPAKGVGTIMRAVREALERGIDLRLDVYGNAPNDEARLERAELENAVAALGLESLIGLHDAVDRTEVIRLLGEADVLVNNAPGGADRVVYEAGASGIPVLASNAAFTDFLDREAFFERNDVHGLADKLAWIAALRPTDRDAIGGQLRDRVEREHSVDTWAAGLLLAARIRSR